VRIRRAAGTWGSARTRRRAGAWGSVRAWRPAGAWGSMRSAVARVSGARDPPGRARPPPVAGRRDARRWSLGGKRALAGVGDPPGRASCPVRDGARTPARDGVLDRWFAHGVDGGV
jgi:hypothetical protein